MESHILIRLRATETVEAAERGDEARTIRARDRVDRPVLRWACRIGMLDRDGRDVFMPVRVGPCGIAVPHMLGNHTLRVH